MTLVYGIANTSRVFVALFRSPAFLRSDHKDQKSKYFLRNPYSFQLTLVSLIAAWPREHKSQKRNTQLVSEIFRDHPNIVFSGLEKAIPSMKNENRSQQTFINHNHDRVSANSMPTLPILLQWLSQIINIIISRLRSALPIGTIRIISFFPGKHFARNTCFSAPRLTVRLFRPPLDIHTAFRKESLV